MANVPASPPGASDWDAARIPLPPPGSVAEAPQEPRSQAPEHGSASVPFLDELYLLSPTQNLSRAAEMIVDHLGGLLNEGRFGECDRLLAGADMSKLSAPLLVAFLGITRAAKAELAARAGFCAKAKAKLVADVGAARADVLLERYS